MQKFPSHKDAFSYLFIGGTMVAILSMLVMAAVQMQWGAALSLLVANVLTWWLWLYTYYEVKPDTLRVQSGPFSWTIRYQDIQSVRRSRSILSSPALALKRLEIAYRGGQILISPKYEQEFLTTLRSKNPNIRIEV